MTSNAKNVYAGEPMSTGGILVFPLGTPPPAERNDPAGASAELPDSGVDLGHIGEDGVTETMERNIDRKRNWGGKVIKIIQSEFTVSYKFTFLESLKADVLRMVYGDDNVKVAAATGDHGVQVAVRKNAKKLKKRTWCIDSIDSELDAHERYWIFEGQIVEVSDTIVVHSDIIQYEVTLEAFPDEQDDHVIMWTDDGNPQGDVISDLGEDDYAA